MAFSQSKVLETYAGNVVYRIVDVTADATTGTIQTGLNRVLAAQLYPKSNSVSGVSPYLTINQGPASTTIIGAIGLTNCTANDVYRVVVYGRA